MDTVRGDSVKKTRVFTPVKTVKTVLGLLIDRIFLAKFTWSGRSKPGTRKIALCDFTESLKFIYTVASKIHMGYTKEDFRSDMVDNVLKFAHVYVYIIFSCNYYC